MKKFASNIKSSLSWKLLFSILLFSSVFTVFVSAYQLFHDYKGDIALIRKRMDLVEKSYLSHLANNVWMVNRTQAEIVLKSILNLPDIEHVELNDRTTELSLSMGRRNTQNGITKEFFLNHTTPEGETFRLGSLVVTATLSDVYNRLESKLFVILGTQAIKTFFVSLFIFFFTYHLITRHLLTIAHFAHSVSFDTLNSKLDLNRKKNPNSSDELDHVTGAINGMRLRLHDETVERERTEEKLRINEGKYRYLFETMTQGVVLQDAEGKIFEVNNSACKILGLTMDQMTGKTAYDPRWKLIREDGSPYDPTDMPSNIALRTGKPVANVLCGIFVPEQDEYRWVMIGSAPQFKEGETKPFSTMTVFTDITEIKRTKESVAQEKERLLTTLRSIGDGVITSDINGCVTIINKVAENLTGWSQAEASGKHVKEVFNIINAITRERCDNPVENVLGEKRIVDLPNHTNLISRDGTERMIADSGSPIFDANGEIVGVILVFRDISERHKIETQLRQSQKLESIGTLAGGVAHEINNPINGIMNYAQLIIDRTEGNAIVTEFAGEIIHETERVATIVRNLLTFAREEKENHSPTVLKDLVDNTMSLIQTVFRKDQISVEIDIPGNLHKIRCRSQQIQQVVMNMVTNARDALNEKYPDYHENKKIVLSSEEIEKEGVVWIRLTVEDRGKGVNADIMERLFDPFFTTKPREVGTGLGLSISYGIVKDHHGELSVESKPGQYTKFHMDLPADNC